MAIRIKPSHRGRFTSWAQQHNMTVQKAAQKVLSAPKGKYSPAVRREANFARNARKFKH